MLLLIAWPNTPHSCFPYLELKHFSNKSNVPKRPVTGLKLCFFKHLLSLLPLFILQEPQTSRRWCSRTLLLHPHFHTIRIYAYLLRICPSYWEDEVAIHKYTELQQLPAGSFSTPHVCLSHMHTPPWWWSLNSLPSLYSSCNTQAFASLQLLIRTFFQFSPLPPSIYQAPSHCKCILHCLFELVQFLINTHALLKLFLAPCQQEGTEGLHFGGTILIDTNFDLVLQSKREGANRLHRLQRNPTHVFTIHFTRQDLHI